MRKGAILPMLLRAFVFSREKRLQCTTFFIHFVFVLFFFLSRFLLFYFLNCDGNRLGDACVSRSPILSRYSRHTFFRCCFLLPFVVHGCVNCEVKCIAVNIQSQLPTVTLPVKNWLRMINVVKKNLVMCWRIATVQVHWYFCKAIFYSTIDWADKFCHKRNSKALNITLRCNSSIQREWISWMDRFFNTALVTGIQRWPE